MSYATQPLTQRLRWRIAHLINRLPGQCWANLVSFALRDRRSPWQPMDSMCRADAARCGACYCGKIRRVEAGEGQ
ncbi:hypothetical protein [Micromonospora sp. NPDC023956]|uniref:hypothetical protein n=1 Tax=Micromonospora sp. NPDC023956 TaxID=3155722 RepID=UPI0033CB3A0B